VSGLDILFDTHSKLVHANDMFQRKMGLIFPFYYTVHYSIPLFENDFLKDLSQEQWLVGLVIENDFLFVHDEILKNP
jgi:hypothetical protein